jgi:anion-transporting  ArsA/GET3 family ATPase
MSILDASAADETLVIDSAPTGHFLRLIEMPGVALDWAHAIMRILLKYHAVGSLDAAARGVLGFAKRLKDLQARLLDPQCSAAFIVTLDESVVIAETERLLRTLRTAAVPVGALVWNRAGPGALPRAGAALHLCPASADAGPSPCVVAPSSTEPLIGTAALRRFVGEWKLLE